MVTAILEHETLSPMDEQTSRALADAATAYEQGPVELRAAILAAADQGDKPADIVRAIRHVYTYDYVARLIREHRGPSRPGRPRKIES